MQVRTVIWIGRYRRKYISSTNLCHLNKILQDMRFVICHVIIPACQSPADSE